MRILNWFECVCTVIDYIEKNLLEDITINDVSNQVNISKFYLQRGFKLMTGYSISEYIRYRRLYLSALEIINSKEKIIDLAYKYGFETPESFSKAFSRFHGISPSQIKNNIKKIKVFLPLKVNITISGGYDMDCIIEKMESFKVIGFEYEVNFDTSYTEIHKLWDSFSESYLKLLSNGSVPKNDIEKVIQECTIGEYGVCIDDIGNNGKFHYMIAGTYHGGEVPQGMKVFEIPQSNWAKFLCVGAMPSALQTVNTKIFQEWLPNNSEYSISMGINIEYYFEGDTSSKDYKSAIWIPITKK